MITIDQLLESVDLDFEPRWVAKDGNGDVYIFEHAPETCESTRQWVTTVPACGLAGYEGLKLAEFENKDWQECIYEVPRKTTWKIEKVEGYTTDKILAKVNEIIDWINKVDSVNELKGAKNE